MIGDYKVTVNPELQAEQYPLPRIEDIFARLAGGHRLWKIDLLQPYHQLKMAADSIDSKKYLTINTYLYGLSVQPTSVRHHICIRYLAAYWNDQVLERTSGTSLYL